ncbi:MAG: hypothetical protein PHT80_13860 [Lentisphaeria bacterium]|nr:hypothetical protein [Lentisphaeria bacterium]
MITASSKSTCPSVEQLSQFLDLTVADLSQPQWDVVASHLQECVACRNKVAAYQRLDQALQVAVLPPAGLADRIIAACQDANARESIRPFPWWRSGWGKAGIAAAVLAFAGLTAVNVSTSGSGDSFVASAPQASATPAMLPAAAEPLLAQVATAVDEPPPAEDGAIATGALYERGKLSGSINSQDLRTVSRMAQKNQVAPATAVKSLLPDTVRHVWTVDDLARSRQRLADASTAMQAPVAWSNDDEQGRLKAVLLLTDGELQQLVDRLGDGHWALVSPYLPQPNAPDLVQVTGKRLQYEIILVQREK